MINLDYLYNPAAAKEHFEKNYFIDRKLDFQIIENGLILPHKKIHAKEAKRRNWGAGGIVNSDGEFIKSSFVNLNDGKAYTPPTHDIQHSSETVIYLGLFYPVWGHSITDNIRRIWFLNSDVFNSDFKDCPLVYIPWYKPRGISDKNLKRLLEILGVDLERLRPITQPTQFDKIILPDGSFEGGFTNEYRETVDRIRNFALKNRTPTSSKKIYYFYGRHQFGEEHLAEYFRSKGYEIISPEKLTLDEQLNVLINAESFASTLGSCAHNALFLRDDTETIIIPRSAYSFKNPYQSKINQVNHQNIIYIDSTLSVFNIRHDFYCFIVSEQLKRFFGDKFDGYEDDDFKAFLEYVKFGITEKNRPISQSAVKSYSAVFQDFMAQLKQREDLIAACDMPLGWEKFRPVLTYRTHVHKDGWCSWQIEEQISNPLNKKRDVQAIKINFSTHKVYYSVYYNDGEGWSEEVIAPEQAGIAGKRKSIFGIKIRLDEDGAKEFDILYRMHKFDGKWTPWAKNGEELISAGIKLNAIQIKLETKRT